VPTRRGWASFGAGLSLWIAARLIGSRDLHMVAAGVTTLPFLAILFVRWSRPRLTISRQLSASRAVMGARVAVTVDVENRGHATTPFLLIEDLLPQALGRPAHLVVSGVPAGREQQATYAVHCRARGRYRVGPLSVYLSDPFGLARTKVLTGPDTELIVYPEVEDITVAGLAVHGAGSGEAAVRFLHRSAAEFYTMREYVTGDDLRRIHWPSVARTGQLMIRQDEATRRSAAVLLLDTRAPVLGSQGAPGFEKLVSVAASLGRSLARTGFTIRLATVDGPAVGTSEDQLLETLAGIVPSKAKSLTPALSTLRTAGPSESTLVLVTTPPQQAETAAILRGATGFVRRVAVLVYPAVLSALPAATAAELEGRATAARLSLVRAGWDVIVLGPEGSLKDAWQRIMTTGRRGALASRS
jgi:uncharacterized protein (DUF58 family)